MGGVRLGGRTQRLGHTHTHREGRMLRKSGAGERVATGISETATAETSKGERADCELDGYVGVRSVPKASSRCLKQTDQGYTHSVRLACCRRKANNGRHTRLTCTLRFAVWELHSVQKHL